MLSEYQIQIHRIKTARTRNYVVIFNFLYSVLLRPWKNKNETIPF